MCVLKVANQGDKTDQFGRCSVEDEEKNEEASQSQEQFLAPQQQPSMFTSYDQNRSREMSAMVSALTHVVSGEGSGNEWGYGGFDFGGSVSRTSSVSLSSPSSSSFSLPSPSSSSYSTSSSSWGGQKRGREEESGGQLNESVLRMYRNFGDFRTSHGESSSGIPDQQFMTYFPAPENIDQSRETGLPSPSWTDSARDPPSSSG
ncbi:hypothetical protein IFM89_032628 [Coptis chinensis]|uniref:Uncharacterized protein n=1 Tax=Coptis chinensis TaxID=261450 RepID=A0A835LP49_9MAGN|nr:hypothetical protein IFM89_032628 [Coptis chinensis]